MKSFIARALLLIGLAGLLSPAQAQQKSAGPQGRVDFARDILPILSDQCFHCHGPDEKARKARLRLDTRDGAFRVQHGVAVIVPGRSAQSELIRRITAKDPDDLMPPPDSNRTLTPTQIALLTRWVDEGAKWGAHWAFVPPAHPEPPKVKGRAWPRNGIDQFILARLEMERLKPSPEADRERLIRRVTFDLTGLPPTPAEMDLFLADKSPGAYEKVVDRLLASPRYGERMATDWLDVARYADTHGYQMDRYRAVWSYRDWVIKAFNENLPFDQFVTWQLAGDLLPDATKEQRLATAFNRLHMQNEEGGIVEEEYRVTYVVDRVNTFGTAFLGLTLECTRCHDHKFDPLTMRDFYSLFSFFQNIDESGQTVYFGEATPVPTLLLSTAEQDAKLAELQREMADKEKELATVRAGAGGAFENWLQTQRAQSSASARTPSLPGLVASFAFDAIVSNTLSNTADASKPGSVHDSFKLVPGRHGQAALLDGENGFRFTGLGHFTRSDAFSFGLWLKAPPHTPRAVVLHKSRAWMDAGSRGYEMLIEDGKVSVGLHHMWPGNSIKAQTKAALPANEWVHMAFTYDGSSRASGLVLYLNGRRAAVEVMRDGLWKDFTYGAGGEPELAIGHRFRDSGFKGGAVDEFTVFNRSLTPLEAAQLAGRNDLAEALAVAPDQLTPVQREGLFDYFLATAHAAARKSATELHALRAGQRKLIEPIAEIMAMEEMPRPKPAFVLQRGAYDSPGDRVTAGTPAFLPPLPAAAPRNRLGLAQWLLQPGHPLTGRVTVNRLWQQMFGRGLIETSDNLGSQGAVPTHPELLDWLATEFIRTGWDVKGMYKLIVTSATYRQSSKVISKSVFSGSVISNQSGKARRTRGSGSLNTDSLITDDSSLYQRDPSNQLLARGPARRLTAEMFRDQALAVSGLLVEKIGGASVKPYQPPGLWEIAMGNPKYDQGKGDALHRRSLYTFWKRTVPPPGLMTFDAADRSNCSVRRQSTSTPLQALALLNDVQLVEAARFVSQRMLREGGRTPDEQVAWAFRLITGRRPAAKEVVVLKQLFAEQKELFTADAGAARKLLGFGETKNDLALNPADLAAGTVLAKAILNHDEAVMRR